MRGFDRETKDSREDERAVMSAWRFGHITVAEAIERIGSGRFKELLTSAERRATKGNP